MLLAVVCFCLFIASTLFCSVVWMDRLQEMVEDKISYFAAKAMPRSEIEPEVDPSENPAEGCFLGGVGERIE